MVLRNDERTHYKLKGCRGVCLISCHSCTDKQDVAIPYRCSAVAFAFVSHTAHMAVGFTFRTIADARDPMIVVQQKPHFKLHDSMGALTVVLQVLLVLFWL